MKITLIGVFVEGLLSFLSPCVLPLIPLYMSYLAGNRHKVDEFGDLVYDKKHIFINTICFVLGISLTFAILSVAVGFLSDYLAMYSEVISIVGGTIVVMFGLHQIGLINIDFLDKESKPKIDLHLENMNYFKAFLLGFIFSIGWSPCIGPMLANAILLSASSSLGYFYIIAYGAGFIIPFIVTGLLTTKVLDAIKMNKHILGLVSKIAGAVLLAFGLYMIINGAHDITLIKNNRETIEVSEDTSKQELINSIYNIDFTDQNGNAIKLANYDGKYVVINFSATWCTYCQSELEDYLKFADNHSDVVVVYAMNTDSDSNVDTITNYVTEKNIDIPVLIDDGYLNYLCGVNTFPSMLIFGPDRSVLTGYSGMVELSQMNELLDLAKQTYNS